MSVDSLFKAAQKSASPPLWSRGVTLCRNGTQFFEESSEQAAERVFQLLVPGEKLSPRVLLWPNDNEWDCDCGDQSPCAHVAGTLIALRQGLVVSREKSSKNADAQKPTHQSLEYHLRRGQRGLSLERRLSCGDQLTVLKGSLRGFLGGQDTGRLPGPPLIASRADHEIDAILSLSAPAEALSRRQLVGLFRAFIAEQKIFLDDKPVEISGEVLKVRIEVADEGPGYRLRRLRNTSVSEVFAHGVALCTNSLKLIAETSLTDEENKRLGGDGIYFAPEDEQRLRSQVLPALEKKISIEITSLKLPQLISLEPRLEILTERSAEGALEVLAKIVYGDPPVAELNPQNYEVVPASSSTRRGPAPLIARNSALERQLVQQLSLNLDLSLGRRLVLHGAAALAMSEKLRQAGHSSQALEQFTPLSSTEWQIQLLEKNGSWNFVMHGEIKNQPREVSFEELHKAWSQGESHVSLIDGTWIEVPKSFMHKHAKRLSDFLALRDLSPAKLVPVQKLELAQLATDMGAPLPASLQKLKAQFEKYEGLGDLTLPSDLRADLRSYQKQGVQWMSFIKQSGMGALLADDMGLGKTLQSLCVLEGRSLVVAPTSVLQNWANEIEKFRPGLKCYLYHGANRNFPTDLAEGSVLLTSYGLLRSDNDKFRSWQWDVALLDEAQMIKNPDSQIAQCAHQIRAKFKIALSGTPVENRIDDLWSQFQFLNPGLLGSRLDFKEKFQSDASTILRAKIRPFILRRLKKDVAKELPPRIENILRCELSSTEREVYDAILAGARRDVVEKLSEGGNMIEALELLLRIRQACCHPSLVPGQRAEALVSSKVTLLLDTLEELLSEGHKALIFSQWTSFLDLIQKEITARFAIEPLRIDGSTTKRQAVVDDFQNNANAKLMLISLKAGGVGLNLTAADHVFIMDPWWNPAAENQAADRAHRIGQQNTVMIHKLIALGTVEEKILELQLKKKDLAESILGGSGGALALTRDDLLGLFQ